MPLRETRRFKTKGFVISFGDIMLPVVGIVAVGLLLVTGRLFFLSGIQHDDNPPLPQIAPVAPVVSSQEKAAQADTLKTVSSVDVKTSLQPAPVPEQRASAAVDVLAVPYDSKMESNEGNSTKVGPVPSPQIAKDTKKAIEPVRTKKVVPVIKETQRRSRAEEKKTAQKVDSTKPTVRTETKNSAPVAKVEQQKAAPAWSVQVGAYSTRSAAELVQEKLARAGYSSFIVNGKTLSRVLVQGGTSRNAALGTASKLSQVGFPGAFIIPPRS